MPELNLDEKRVLIYSGERIKKLKQEKDAIDGKLKTLASSRNLSQQEEIDKIYMEERSRYLVQEKDSLETQWIKLSEKQNGKA